MLRYCLSVKWAEAPPAAFPAEESRLLLSLCSGDECLKDAEPFLHPAAPSNPPPLLHGSANRDRCGETECDRWCPCSNLGSLEPPSISFDISCFSCACPASRSWIFFSSSSAGVSMDWKTPNTQHPIPKIQNLRNPRWNFKEISKTQKGFQIYWKTQVMNLQKRR